MSKVSKFHTLLLIDEPTYHPGLVSNAPENLRQVYSESEKFVPFDGKRYLSDAQCVWHAGFRQCH